MHVIGIIGGVASGKSTIAKRLGELGAVVLDADIAGHEVLHDETVKAAIRKRFGDKVFTSDGQIDRHAVARIVFHGDATANSALADLEAISHPKIGQRLAAQLATLEQESIPAVVLDAALLLKAGWDRLCDTIIFADVPREQRLARAAARGWSAEELDAREARQTPLAQKRAAADVTIDSSCNLSHTLTQVDQFWAKLCRDIRSS